MFRTEAFFHVSRGLVFTVLLLRCVPFAVAQRHEHMGSNMPGGMSRPDGVEEKDTLKDFNHALAVQATTQQIAEFQTLVNATAAAQEQLGFIQRKSDKNSRPAFSALDQVLEDARAKNRRFQQGFSEPQKSGLKDLTKRLDKADSDLEQEQQHLERAISSEAKDEISAHLESLEKSLGSFSNEQLALGREMGITLASGQDLAFNLPASRSSVRIGDREISISVSGSLAQVAAAGEMRTFTLKMSADLSDLQQNVMQIMSSVLDRENNCRQRLSLRNATIMSTPPASTLALSLHFERWTCASSGQFQTELAEGDGSVEFTFTPTVDGSGQLVLDSNVKRIDGSGMVGEELRSGDLSADLGKHAAGSILTALLASSDFERTLPGAVRSAAKLRNARFEDPGAGGLAIAYEGEVQISNEQVSRLASQLNQTLSAQGSSSPSSGR
ncbi:MAG TPA: hypothetical protein VMB66_07025 [Candidatus Acidoferrales bacterium]|nr:hypothetical protein [Candidatus Acidoferrales bacterium]